MKNKKIKTGENFLSTQILNKDYDLLENHEIFMYFLFPRLAGMKMVVVNFLDFFRYRL